MPSLLEKLQTRRAKVGVVGLGYVGLPLALAFAEAGFEVFGFELSAEKVEAVNAGRSYLLDLSTERLAPQVRAGRLRATMDFSQLRACDAISVCVPTPLNKTRDPDLTYIVEATEEIAKNLRAGQVVVLESTTYPGTTVEVVAPALSQTGLKLGEDIFLAFSPERIDPGNEHFDVRNTPKVIGGMTPACGQVAQALYQSIIAQVLCVSSPTAAEMVKLLENTFRAVNIALVNELAIIAHKLDVDVWEIIEAAASKPFGFMPFYPGPGLGGHCIPIDPHYLSWKLRTLNYRTRFIELADDINSHMPEHVVARVADALNDLGRAVRGSKILILGVAYKRDVSDWRESPAAPLIEGLQRRGGLVSYHDRLVPTFGVGGVRGDEARMLHSVALREDYSDLADYDCVVIVTDHRYFDAEAIERFAKRIVDTRNLLGRAGLKSEKVVSL